MADPAVFLAALGIAVLEFAEAAAVGLTLYADSRRYSAFGYVALGSVAVLFPTFLVGGLIALLPISLVRFIGGVLLLYLGLRLVKSARKSVLRVRIGAVTPPEHRER